MNNQDPFEVFKIDNKKVNIIVRGDLKRDFLAILKVKILEAEKIIRDAVASEGKVKISVDATEFTGVYDPECFVAFAEFLKINREYVQKTAIFGGPQNMKLIIDALAVFGDRENIAVFNTKEEAESWLL